MDNKDIKSLLITKLNLEKAYIEGDKNHINIIVIGNIFKGVTQVKRQQMVYAPLLKVITEKHIHAVSIMSYTPEEWKKKNKINNSNHLLK